MSLSTPRPIRLKPADAERYARLRLRMLTTIPWAFDASPGNDEALDRAWIAKAFAEEHSATFAIEAPNPSGSDYVVPLTFYPDKNSELDILAKLVVDLPSPYTRPIV